MGPDGKNVAWWMLLATALALAGACAPLNRTPPFRSPAYAKAVREVDEAPLRFGADELQASWARVEIDAPRGVPLAGYGDRHGVPSRGVRDPSYVRAFAVRAGGSTILLFTADLLLLDPWIASAIRSELKDLVAADAIFFTASHTHSGPGGYTRGLLWELVFGPYDQRAFDAVVRAHVTAGREALSSLAPARLGSAHVPVSGLSANRVERGGPTDDELFLLTFEREDHRRALLWSFGCHAVTLGPDNLFLSADYPGVIARDLEGAGFDMVAYAAGGIGSSNPRYERRQTEWLTGPLRRGIERGLRLAEANAKSAGRVASVQTTVSLPPFRYRIAPDRMILTPLLKVVVDIQGAAMGAIAINDVLLVHSPAEVSGELTREIRRDAARRGINLALLPFDGSYVGYVVPQRVYDLPEDKGAELFEYETRTMAFLGPYEADLLLNLELRLAERVHGRVMHKAPW
jgi:hypothetical protein